MTGKKEEKMTKTSILEKYKQKLIDEYVNNGTYTLDKIESHIESIKAQKISNMFYLPPSGKLDYEAIALLDSPTNISLNFLQKLLFSPGFFIN